MMIIFLVRWKNSLCHYIDTCRTAFLYLGVCITIFSSCTLSAYEIGPEGTPFDSVHQALTKNALDCLLKNKDQKPSSCMNSLNDCLKKHSTESCLKEANPTTLYLDKYSSTQLASATTWPDDPTDEIGIRGTVTFWGKVKFFCQQYLKNSRGLDVSHGLLCNSHFGNFQFWHAQASSRDESAKNTRDKILAWAKFNYEVAIGAISADKDYCTYFDENPSAISEIMKPSTYPYCKERKAWNFLPSWLRKPYPAYDIATLYGMKCKNPFSSNRCIEDLINSPSKRMDKTIISATGALLHLVQDSYSQSHVRRGDCFEELNPKHNHPQPVSKIVCKPIESYTNYAQYNNETHKVDTQIDHEVSDKWPKIDGSCFSSQNFGNDPITISAKILRHIQEKSKWDDVLVDIGEVFNSVGNEVNSGPGICYGNQVN